MRNASACVRSVGVSVLVALMVAALCAAVLAMSPAKAAASEPVPTVVYDASSGEFSFRDAPDGDLFASFKGVMPGDELKQEIAVEVVNSREVVSVYVSARYADAELSGIEGVGLSATFGDAETRTGTLGDRHGMGQAVKLADFKGDGRATGIVELRVAESLDNGTAGDIRTLTWEFTAQHEGMLPSDGNLAQTGDEAGDAAVAAASACIAALAVAAFAFAMLRRRAR